MGGGVLVQEIGFWTGGSEGSGVGEEAVEQSDRGGSDALVLSS